MGKYDNWDKKQLLVHYNELIKKFVDSNNEDEEILRDISVLDKLIKGHSPTFYKPNSIKEKLYEDTIFIQKYQSFLHDIQIFKEKSHLLKKFTNLKVEERDISNSILLSVTHDFYNSLDPVIARHFNHVFKDRKNNLKFSNNSSYSSYIPSIDKGYINLEKNNTICDFLYLIHEYAHLIQDRIKFRDTYLNYPFNEMLPILMEMIAFDYLEESFEDFEEDIKTIKIARMKTNLKFASYLLKEYKYISLDRQNKSRHLIADIANTTNISRKESFELLNTSAEEKFAYVIPTILDIELYYLFYHDKDKCMDLIFKLIEVDNLDFRKYIKDSGIILNQHSKQYIKQLKK